MQRTTPTEIFIEAFDPSRHPPRLIARLLYQTEPPLFRRLFGRWSPIARQRLEKMLGGSANTFAGPHCLVATLSGQVAGLVVVQTPDDFDSQAEAAEMLHLMPWRQLLRLAWWQLWLFRRFNQQQLPPKTAYIANLSIRPALRHRGVAQALLAAATDRARQRGCGSLTLQVAAENTAARQLYQKTGFQVTRIIRLRFPVRYTSVKMRRELLPTISNVQPNTRRILSQ